MSANVYHWRKVRGLKPPCGKASLYMRDDLAQVTCPECLDAARCPKCGIPSRSIIDGRCVRCIVWAERKGE